MPRRFFAPDERECFYISVSGERPPHLLDIDETVGLAFQEELNKQHGAGKIKFYRVDVMSDEQLLGAFQSVVAEHGGIDVTALVTSTLKALELMRVDEGGKGGTVINISSIAGLSQPESAAKGVIEAYKLGKSGSTWLATRDLPVRDISDNITKAYEIMGEHN
ncbi:hypothetical protein MSG28_003587 [Choristoneura fumiferana]|uniref:Uncharacterized protein n=1 Tax=Choristoneura fumiferana TaxID=7141 RepID=A0ACC0KFD7_CHOFU|nr:hypothetical protein MSG28_003587 [Choristoneura fumiferana]